MPNLSTTQLQTVRMMSEGGPTSPGAGADYVGGVYRPFFAVEDRSERLAGLSTLYDFFINNVPDPDTAYARDPLFDEKMRQHWDAGPCLNLRELTVAGMPSRIEPSAARGIDKGLARKIADYVSDRLEALKPGKVELYEQMQQAVACGGAGHEWIWQRGADGIEFPVTFHDVHKSRFVFDVIGNMSLLTRQTPVYGTYVKPALESESVTDRMGLKQFPAGKFTYHRYRARGGPWYRPAFEGFAYYGRGENNNLYIPVTFDYFVLRFRVKWLEKFGYPPMVLKHPDNTMANVTKKIAQSALDQSVITIPRPVGSGREDDFYTLEALEVQKTGYDAFQEFYERWTKPVITKIVLGDADQQGGKSEGSQGGYSSDVNKKDAGPQIIYKRDALRISETLDIQWIPHVVRAKWPGLPDEYLPRHVMEPKEEKDRVQETEILEKVSMHVPVKETDWYEAAGIEKPGDGEETVGGESQNDPNAGLMEGMDGHLPGGKPPAGANGNGKPVTPIGMGNKPGKESIANGGGAFKRPPMG